MHVTGGSRWPVMPGVRIIRSNMKLSVIIPVCSERRTIWVVPRKVRETRGVPAFLDFSFRQC